MNNYTNMDKLKNYKKTKDVKMKTKYSLSLGLLSLAVLAGCNSTEKADQNQVTKSAKSQKQVLAPVAKKVAHEMNIHGSKRVDDYYWMRDDKRENPEILAHLTAENNYTDAMLKHTENLQDKLFNELKSRIEKDDDSVPVKRGDFYYSSEMRGENEYPIYVRSKNFKGDDKQVLLDVNKLAKNHEYFQVSGLDVSPNEPVELLVLN